MRANKRTVLFQQKLRTAEEIAEITGVPLKTIKGRLRTLSYDPNIDHTDVLSRPLNCMITYLYAGKQLTVAEIAKETKSSLSFVYDVISRERCRQGTDTITYDLLPVIKSARIRQIKVYCYRRKNFSLSKLAEKVKIPAVVLKKYRRKGISVQETIRIEKGLDNASQKRQVL